MEKDLDMAGLNEAIRDIYAKLNKPKTTKKTSKKKQD